MEQGSFKYRNEVLILKYFTREPGWDRRGHTITTLAPFLRRIVVQDGWVALLFRKGKFQRLLKPGQHFAFGWRIDLQDVDVTECPLVVGGKEVLID